MGLEYRNLAARFVASFKAGTSRKVHDQRMECLLVTSSICCFGVLCYILAVSRPPRHTYLQNSPQCSHNRVLRRWPSRKKCVYGITPPLRSQHHHRRFSALDLHQQSNCMLGSTTGVFDVRFQTSYLFRGRLDAVFKQQLCNFLFARTWCSQQWAGPQAQPNGSYVAALPLSPFPPCCPPRRATMLSFPKLSPCTKQFRPKCVTSSQLCGRVQSSSIPADLASDSRPGPLTLNRGIFLLKNASMYAGQTLVLTHFCYGIRPHQAHVQKKTCGACLYTSCPPPLPMRPVSVRSLQRRHAG